MTEEKMQVLIDRTSSGKDRDWNGKREGTDFVAQAFEEIGDIRRALQLRSCSTILMFKENPEGKRQLAGAWFCRHPLCPICTWRKSLKIGAQTSQIVDYLAKNGPKMRYIMLTLTVRNVREDELNGAIDDLFKGWKRMEQRKRFKEAVKGWYRALEVTHDVDPFITKAMYRERKEYYDRRFLGVGDANPNYDTYHPHFHVLLAVSDQYFKGKNYIKHDEWVGLWQEAMRLDYEPNIDVRTVKGDTSGAIAETAKYAAKSNEYIIPDDWDLTVKSIVTLFNALRHRRLIAYGGSMKEARKVLKLQDVEKADLVHIEGEEPVDDGAKTVVFVWYAGYRQYRRVEA